MAKESTKLVIELLNAYAQGSKSVKLKSLLYKLKAFKSSLNEHNINSFEKLLNELMRELPDEYAYKLKSFDYYSNEPDPNDVDLPF